MTNLLAVTDLDPGSTDGLEARVHDALWLLGRQWQMGELRGEDAGSPAGARMAFQWARVTLTPGEGDPPGNTIAGRGRPLEAQVEAESWAVPAKNHFRLAAETGQRLTLILRAAGADQVVPLLRDRFMLAAPPAGTPADAAALRYVELLAGRTIDGIALLRALVPDGRPRPLGALPGAAPFDAIEARDQQRALESINRWLKELEDLAPEALVADGAGGAPAWRRERMEYAFAAEAHLDELSIRLDASEYLDGRIDWTTFTVDPSRSAPTSAPAVTEGVHTFLPTPVRLPGAPLLRFWELEDARLSLPRLEAVRSDPATRLFLDFALGYGNDWFSVPLRLPAGSLSRLRYLIVTDTFGERQLVRHAALTDSPETTWRMFALSIVPSDLSAMPDEAGLARYLDLFLLPAPPTQVLESPAVEEVRLVRDELANLAWAIEARVEGPGGQPVDLAEQDGIDRGAATHAAPPSSGARRYRLGVSAPNHWVPLLPGAEARTDAPRMLDRGVAPRVVDGEVVGALLARGRILEPGTTLRLYDEEVPREGAVVKRVYRLTRSPDGGTHLWIGRRKGPGRGGGSSGLRFDVVE